MTVARCKNKLPEAVRNALEETGLPWTIEAGKRHFHLRIAGRLATALPQNMRFNSNQRAILNTIRSVRTCARAIHEEKNTCPSA